MKQYENISLKPYNTFGIDVKARRLIVIEKPNEVDDVLPTIDGKWMILGAGSDVVFTRDYEGTVIILGDFKILIAGFKEPVVYAWAGLSMDSFIQWAIGSRYYGLENLSAIPGTVGAAVVQNVGAYGVEAKDFIEKVEAYDVEQHRRCSFSNAECQFAYRDSIFKHNPGRYLITGVYFRLFPDYRPNLSYRALESYPHATAEQLRNSIMGIRWSKLPRPEEHGSAGSFFKNPMVDEATYLSLRAEYPDMPLAYSTEAGYKLSAGWLIDRAGWKGKTMGRVGVWPKNALVLYNTGGCTGDEVVALADAIVADVQKKFNITLTPEAIII